LSLHLSETELQKNLLEWFDLHGRKWIPWKLNSKGYTPLSTDILSPYQIWIAEVMLQQTQLNVVLPYWFKWINVFPSLIDLSQAKQQDVLMLWQGLGYYSRAKRILQSSKILINLIPEDKYLDNTFWPVKLEQWMSLPGVGRSTAGSIISSAFNLPYPILDGNVKRILSRLFACEKTLNKNEKYLWELSSSILPVENPRDFNQALMDLGTKVCTRTNPSCSICPLQNFCIAYIEYDPCDFPKKCMKKIIPYQEIGIGIIFNREGKLLIDQRLEDSNMGGMWEFPGGKKLAKEPIEKTIEREIEEELGIDIDVGIKLLSFEHAYSNKKLHFTVHICELIAGEPKALASQKFLWISPEKLCDFPFPAANTKIISELHKHLCI
tara:strand:- start:2798 stop:3937 length:1140 start_codon:yes stop_codon:yes gene_type:complete